MSAELFGQRGTDLASGVSQRALLTGATCTCLLDFTLHDRLEQRFLVSEVAIKTAAAGLQADRFLEIADTDAVKPLAGKQFKARFHDPRRQPMQAPPFITGNITTELVASMNGDWRATGSNFIDEYVQPGSAGVAPEIRNLVLIAGGAPASVLNSGSTVTRSSFSVVRVNASGLASRAVFRVNGAQVVDDSAAPFELPAAKLAMGTSQISVTTYAANGLQSQRSVSVTVR